MTKLCNVVSVSVIAIVFAPVAALATIHNLTASLDGPQANAGAGTGSLGTGTATVTYDDASGVLSWNVSWSGLSGSAAAAHFHGPALPNQNAGVQVGIGVGSPSVGSQAISPLQAADLLADLWYLNVHTMVDPGGEIRGQVLFQGSGTTTTTTTTTLPSSLCGATPAGGCLGGLKAGFQQKDKSGDSKDLLKWKITKGDAFSQVDLGDPMITTTYALCIYDETANTPALVGALIIDPNLSWDDKDPKGFNYKDKAGAGDGVTKIQLKAGDQGKTKVQLKAKGSTAGWPVPISPSKFFDQDTVVTVQLVNSTTATCWTSEFQTNKKNTGDQFKAKAP